LHEGIHAWALQRRGRLPDYATRSELALGCEAATEWLSRTVEAEVKKRSGGIFERGQPAVLGYNVEVGVLRALVEVMGVSQEMVQRFTMEQNFREMWGWMDGELRQMSKEDYGRVVDGMYRDLKIGPTQRELLKTKRIGSVMDLAVLSREWLCGTIQPRFLGVVPNWTFGDYQEMAKRDWTRYGLAPIELYDDFDAFMRYVEAKAELVGDSTYTPINYYSETEQGQMHLYQNSQWLKALNEQTLNYLK